MASALKISRLISRSSFSSISRGGNGYLGATLSKYSTAAATEEPIKPGVKVEHTQLLIDGKFVDAASGKTFPTLDPRTGEVIAHVAEGHSEDVNRAVAAARKAFDEGPWPKMPAYERQRILLRAADLIEKHNDDIAALETWDNGKTYEQSAQIEIPMLLLTTITMDEPAAGLKTIFSFIFPDQKSGKVELQYQHEYAGISTSIGLTASPIVNFSGVIGNNLVAVGTDLSFDTASGNFTKYNARLNITHTDLIASLTMAFAEEDIRRHGITSAVGNATASRG